MRLTLLLSTLLLASSCGPFRTAKAPLPPPTPMPARIPDQVSSTEPAPPPKNLPPPPAIATHPDTRPAPTAQMSIPTTPTEPPPRPVRPKKAVRRAATPPPPVAASAETAVEPAAPPAYRLGELRTPEQRDKLRRQAETMINICSAALSAAEGRQLTAMQAEMVNRVKAFSQQARETLETDPGEARNFASKGKTFAEALLAELKK